jgi:uncharacterized membrane protein
MKKRKDNKWIVWISCVLLSLLGVIIGITMITDVFIDPSATIINRITSFITILLGLYLIVFIPTKTMYQYYLMKK